MGERKRKETKEERRNFFWKLMEFATIFGAKRGIEI